MNGQQIEMLLQLIDNNVNLTRQEALIYIKDHQMEIARELAQTGHTTVKTGAGKFSLSVDDLGPSPRR